MTIKMTIKNTFGSKMSGPQPELFIFNIINDHDISDYIYSLLTLLTFNTVETYDGMIYSVILDFACYAAVTALF